MDDAPIRLDKWLWFARVVKTRTLAQKLVRSHKIRLNKLKISNPAKTVAPGDVLTITLERQIKVLEITACANRRGPYSFAATLYKDLSPIPKPRTAHEKSAKNAVERVSRPDKYARRKLLALKNRQHYQ